MQRMKKIVFLLIGVLLLSGCIREETTTETKITKTQGIGVLEYRAVVNEMLADTYNYVLLSVRNNAGGSSAKKIIASLENVQPFKMYECNQEQDPSDERLSVCNQFFDDVGIPYRSHRINQMLPNEEIQFFWNLQAPTDEEIVNMQYSQTIYYTLEYHYVSTVTQTIVGISQEEYLERSQEGPVNIAGQTIKSPGEISLESKTQQPLIYSEGSATPLEFRLQFDISNVGSGVLKPGTDILIAVKKDALTDVIEGEAEELEWNQYGDNTGKDNDFDDAFPPIEFPEITRENMWLLKIPGDQLNQGSYSITLPMEFTTTDIYEPQKILTITAYISYTYLKEGSTTISVYPAE